MDLKNLVRQAAAADCQQLAVLSELIREWCPRGTTRDFLDMIRVADANVRIAEDFFTAMRAIEKEPGTIVEDWVLYCPICKKPSCVRAEGYRRVEVPVEVDSLMDY